MRTSACRFNPPSCRKSCPPNHSCSLRSTRSTVRRRACAQTHATSSGTAPKVARPARPAQPTGPRLSSHEINRRREEKRIAEENMVLLAPYASFPRPLPPPRCACGKSACQRRLLAQRQTFVCGHTRRTFAGVPEALARRQADTNPEQEEP